MYSVKVYAATVYSRRYITEVYGRCTLFRSFLVYADTVGELNIVIVFYLFMSDCSFFRLRNLVKSKNLQTSEKNSYKRKA